MPNHATGTTPLYRLYHSETDNHFYTVNKAERDQVVNKYDYRDEGPAAYVFTDQSLFPPENACLKPLLRYWHAGLRRHRYTIDHNDLGIAKDGWVFERAEGYIAISADCYAPGARPFYQLWNDARQKHLYTMSDAEARYAKEELGFRSEGIIGFLLPSASTTYKTTPLYRHYSTTTGDHFYTTQAREATKAAEHGYRAEGIAGYVFTRLADPPTTSPSPQLDSNFATGAPLSSFILSASGLTAGDHYRVLVTDPDTNEPTHYMTTVSVDGNLSLHIVTNKATITGTYTIQLVADSAEASLQTEGPSTEITIQPDDPVRSEGLLEPQTSVLVIAADVAPPGDPKPSHSIYLPLLRR